MKTLGILLLFGLCTAIGIRLASQKCEGMQRIRALERELAAIAERFDGGNASLRSIAQSGQGMLSNRLCVYLDALSAGRTEAEAAQNAAEPFVPESLHAEALLFFDGLSLCPRAELKRRIERLNAALSDAMRNAEPLQRQAKLIRAVGVLCGAALAVLLW